VSGGAFEYNQYNIGRIADEIQSIVDAWDAVRLDDYDGHEKTRYCELYSPETKAEFEKAILLLRQAEVYANRIDWLLSGDDSDATFHERLKSDLDAVEKRCEPSDE
jgi:hypothetical protein